MVTWPEQRHIWSGCFNNTGSVVSHNYRIACRGADVSPAFQVPWVNRDRPDSDQKITPLGHGWVGKRQIFNNGCTFPGLPETNGFHSVSLKRSVTR
ncbi:hypothetical protein MTE1_5140 [Klebsiella pneumoniae JHCK1]|nr:hypothetical protein MTE1_5140 [Klebsiella pneumoniae JHCK1]